uniref:GUN4-like domain-containing protein n=1 Tax=Renouxia sp. TaxID=2485823 RepID=A0A3G3MHS3_9FLOR|nr:hypothetical protein [Renouxia sp.]
MNNQLKEHLLLLKKISTLQDTSSIRKQTELINKIRDYEEPGLLALLNLLIERRIDSNIFPCYMDGIVFKYLYLSNYIEIKKQTQYYFNEGIVKLKSSADIDYMPLQHSLIHENFQHADRLTHLYLCELAGLNKTTDRKWLYFTDILGLPSEDLRTIDMLWKIHSKGKFGFSIQRHIWLSNNQNWDKLWHKIGWKTNNTSLRYPNEFIWDTTAPIGHLPLFNQLRGVQVLYSLFEHPAWENI